MLLVTVVALDGRSEAEFLELAAGHVAGRTVALASPEDFAALGISAARVRDWPERLRRQGQSVLLVAVDGRTAGLLGFMEEQMGPSSVTQQDVFSTETAGLPQAHSPEWLDLAPGAQYELRIAPLTKRIGASVVRMLAYNGSVPGPTLRVQQGAELLVNVVNDGDLESTVHWHGLRLDNRYDGTTMTQRPIQAGGSFTYRLTFPDPGVYWYHPHVREDYGQEMGLYGNIVVVPSEPDYWPPANREITLALDDVLIEDGKVAAFSRGGPTYTAMGRFGNVMLVNGEAGLCLRAQRGEVVRCYLTNTANTRVFNVSLPRARMKLVGGDSGRYEHERLIESVIIAPSERVVVDVLFDRSGSLTLEHRTPDRTYPLATIAVTDRRADPSLASTFLNLRTNADLAAARLDVAAYLGAEPTKTLALVAEMDMGAAQPESIATPAYVCPMHPDVTSARPERCPRCGMKLVPSQLVPHDSHGHQDHREDIGSREHSAIRGVEWEDDMVEVNRITNATNMRWKLIDRRTGAENSAIDWRFRVGDYVKIRLANEMDSDHPMHHPFHIHGAGRFLILSRDGIVEPNLVWKDTVLVPTGQIVDILLEVTHPGVWMAHCHIAEHHESGMMFTFRVDQ